MARPRIRDVWQECLVTFVEKVGEIDDGNVRRGKIWMAYFSLRFELHKMKKKMVKVNRKLQNTKTRRDTYRHVRKIKKI